MRQPISVRHYENHKTSKQYASDDEREVSTGFTVRIGVEQVDDMVTTPLKGILPETRCPAQFVYLTLDTLSLGKAFLRSHG